MTDENAYLLDMFENLMVYYSSDYEIPTDVLEEVLFYVEVELRERDEEVK